MDKFQETHGLGLVLTYQPWYSLRIHNGVSNLRELLGSGSLYEMSDLTIHVPATISVTCMARALRG